MTAQVDALVIGAGWSGLVCALRLSKAGKKVICLEARSRLGGRAFTHSWNDETPMSNNERIVKEDEVGSKTHHVDFGCSYIHGYNEGNPVKEIAKKYNVQTYIAKPTSTRIIGPNGVLNSQLSEKLQTNLQSAQSFAKEKAIQIRKSSSTLGKISLSSILLEDPSSPLFNNLQDENERQLAISLSRSMHIPLGTEIENVALEYFGHEKAFGGTDAMPEGGFSTLIAKLAEEFKQSGGQIHKGEEVKKILHLNDSKSNSIQVITSKQIDGNSASTKEEKYSARTAIVTIPLAVLKNQHQTLFEPSLENERKEAIERINVGNLNKVLLTYEKPWWNSDVGTFFVLPSKSQSSSNAIPTNTLKDLFESTTMIVSSLCAPTGYSDQMKSYSLLVMIGGEHAKVLEKHDRITVAEALNEYLFSRLTKDSQTPKLSHTFYSRWAKQPFTQGATTTPIVLGSSPNDLLTISKPTWNNSLHFAGEHCEINHRGSIVGAVLSGQNASESVLQYLKENGMASL